MILIKAQDPKIAEHPTPIKHCTKAEQEKIRFKKNGHSKSKYQIMPAALKDFSAHVRITLLPLTPITKESTQNNIETEVNRKPKTTLNLRQ